MKLSGNFYIEGVYLMGYYHKLAFRLEKSQDNSLLPVVIDYNRSILFNDDLRLPPPSYKPMLPTKFAIIRKGNQLSVMLNNDIVAVKRPGAATEFETLKIGLTAVLSNKGRLYRLKVSTLARTDYPRRICPCLIRQAKVASKSRK